MNKNIKKIAAVILATNVLASTVITTLPIGTHAAEEKLASNLKASSETLLNYVQDTDTEVTGKIPNGAGKHVTIEAINALNGVVTNTYTGVADAQGNFTIPVSKMNINQYVRATFENGDSVKQSITHGNMADFQLDPINKTDRVISGSFAGHPDATVVLTATKASYPFTTKTDANGNFKLDLPSDYSLANEVSIRFTVDDTVYASRVFLSEIEQPILPAVALNTTGIETASNVDDSGKMTTGVLPTKANQSVTYTSSDPSVMKVKADGTWTAISSGSATIKVASLSNPLITTSIPVTVSGVSTMASLNYVQDTDTEVTGKIPNGAGKHVTIEAINALNGVVTNTYTGVADAQGNFTIPVSKMNINQYVRATFENGDSVKQFITHGNMADFQLDPINKTDRVISGSFAGHPDATIVITATKAGYPFTIKTDANGNFKLDLPSDYSLANETDIRFTVDGSTYASRVFLSEIEQPILPAVAFDTTGIETASNVGDSGKMTTGVLPTKANQSVTYTSSDPSIMKVNADGTWTAISSGSATIKVASSSNAVIATTIPVTVADPLGDASTAVNTLFSDAPTNTVLKNTTTLAMIDAASAQVNLLPASATKTKLQSDIANAKVLFNQIAPTTIDAITTDSVKVTGKGEPNAPVTIKNGTTTIGTGTIKADGTFEIAIAKQAANATITASVTKASNNKTATASTKVTQVFDHSLTANAYKMGDTKLTGKVGKDVFKVRLWINGAVAVQGVINADGTYEFPTAANFIKLIGDKVEVVAVDSKYAEVNRTTVAVTGTSTFDNALTVNKFNAGDTKISGTIGKDISKVRLWVNDKVVAQAPTTTDGTYTFANASSFITSPLDKVEVVGVDAQYKEMNRKTVSLPGSDTYNNTFSVDNYFIGQNTLGGSYGQNTSKVRLWVNGVVVKQADLNPADSTYTLKGIFGLIKSKTDVAEVVYVDAQYKEIKRVAVIVK